jgi:hypothetical protein
MSANMNNLNVHVHELDQENADDKPSRSTFKGNIEPVVDKLVELLKTKNSMTLISYADECDDVHKSKLKRGDLGLEGNMEFQTIAHEFQPNMSYGKICVRNILRGVIKRGDMNFKSAPEKDDWLETMMRRWRNCCHHSMKIQRKEDLPKWAADLFPWLDGKAADQAEEDPGIGDLAEQGEAAGSTAPGSPPVQTKIEVKEEAPRDEEEEDQKWDQKYETKFSTELMLPLRRTKGDHKAQWEPGVVKPQAGEIPHDPYEEIIGTWPDDVEIKLDRLWTYGFLNGLVRANAKQPPAKDLWTGTHTITKHTITIKQRVDRDLLLSLYEQNAQILQIKMNNFGDVYDTSKLPDDSVILKKAVEFMQPIAEDFIADKIQKAEKGLQIERDHRK